MMMFPKKKIATLIVAGLPKDKGPSVEPVSNEEPESDNSIALEAAADAMLSAMESKDAKALAYALQDFMAICESGEDEGPEPELGEG